MDTWLVSPHVAHSIEFGVRKSIEQIEVPCDRDVLFPCFKNEKSKL